MTFTFVASHHYLVSWGRNIFMLTTNSLGNLVKPAVNLFGFRLHLLLSTKYSGLKNFPSSSRNLMVNNNIIVDLLPPLPCNPITSYRLVKSFKMIRLFPSSQQKPAELSICPQTMIFLHLSGSSSYCCHLIYFSSNHNLREPAWQEINSIECFRVGGVKPGDLVEISSVLNFSYDIMSTCHQFRSSILISLKIYLHLIFSV